VRKLTLSFLLIALCIGASPAFAIPIELKYDQVIGGYATTIKFLSNGYETTESVYTGFSQVDIKGMGTFNAFCVDPANSSSAYQQYSLQHIAHGSSYERVAWLLSTATSGNAVASQLAAWEIMFETKEIGSYSSGTFQVLNWDYFGHTENLSLQEQAAERLKAALDDSNLAKFDVSKYYLAASPGSGTSFGKGFQDFVVDPPVATPEPASMLLLGTGVLGLVAFRRKLLR
jgi:hypothetical protein